MVDKCRRRSSKLGQAVPALVVWTRHRMRDGNFANWQGSGGLGRMDCLARLGILWLGLGMWDFGGDGPEMHCFVWGFVVAGLEGVG